MTNKQTINYFLDKYDQSHVEQVNFDKDDEVDLAKVSY